MDNNEMYEKIENLYNEIMYQEENWIFIDPILNVDKRRGGFMFHFGSYAPMDCQTFIHIQRQLDDFTETETIDMSSAYDEYLERHHEDEANNPMTRDLTRQFDELIDKYFPDASGAEFAFVCRMVEHRIRQAIEGN